ncbi:unnamed protein product [Hermetia illucens]|uniref:Uncharacterized protein n=1 Tax=Hermetia illucens TaxID=343691 RepID=A0A7R8UJH6_HERIL|nr:unnamed protein product [Hermetia illucens]
MFSFPNFYFIIIAVILSCAILPNSLIRDIWQARPIGFGKCRLSGKFDVKCYTFRSCVQNTGIELGSISRIIREIINFELMENNCGIISNDTRRKSH